jgi:hypothetical protein
VRCCLRSFRLGWGPVWVWALALEAGGRAAAGGVWVKQARAAAGGKTGSRGRVGQAGQGSGRGQDREQGACQG